jgi:hypothetical protein
LTKRELSDNEIRRYAREMKHERLDAKAPRHRLFHLMIDRFEISIVDVNAPAVNPQPGTTVKNTAAPPTDLGNFTLPTEVT